MYDTLQAVWDEMTAPGQMFEVTTTEVRGSPTRCFVAAPPSLRELWASTAGYGDREYLIYKNERLTFTQCQLQTASIANWLDAQGVQPGDHVAIAMRNYPEWMLAYWAITSMGVVVVGMNAWWVASEVKYCLEDSKPKVIIADRERLARLEEVREDFPDLKAVAVRMGEDAPDWTTTWEEVLKSDPKRPEVTIDPDEDACIFYTSGTTGTPKGARLTHRGCVNNVLNVVFINMVQATALAKVEAQKTGQEPEPADPNAIPCALLATPLFHVTGNNCVAQAMAAAGGKLVHMYKWDAAEALKIIEEEKVSSFGAVPMMSREMLLHPDFAVRDTSSLQTIGGGGAALQPDLVKKLDEGLKNAKPNTGYGMTETCGLIAAVGSDFFLDRPASVGPAMPTLEAKCVDEEGNALAVNEVGELWVRGAPVIKGYLNRPEATAEDITDGWLHTGDVAYIDEDGFIYLVDRAKDMVIRGGENVYCSEVENAIFHHEAVAECIVFAVEDERLGEEVGAALYLQEGKSIDADELRAFCRESLAAYKIPRYIWVMDAPLPRNANGKFVKRAVSSAVDLADAV